MIYQISKILKRICCIESKIDAVSTPTPIIDYGNEFPSDPEDGQGFYRNDLCEQFRYDSTTGTWLGECQFEGFGDSGGSGANYLRRFNGMITGIDQGVIFPYDILIKELTYNWNTPNNATGAIQIRGNGVTIFSQNFTLADSVTTETVNTILPAGEILSFFVTTNVANSQGRIRFKKIAN